MHGCIMLMLPIRTKKWAFILLISERISLICAAACSNILLIFLYFRASYMIAFCCASREKQTFFFWCRMHTNRWIGSYTFLRMHTDFKFNINASSILLFLSLPITSNWTNCVHVLVFVCVNNQENFLMLFVYC